MINMLREQKIEHQENKQIDKISAEAEDREGWKPVRHGALRALRSSDQLHSRWRGMLPAVTGTFCLARHGGPHLVW